MNRTHVRIFYPADPVGIVPGGIDTFLRGIIKWAPPDLAFSLVGMTTDPKARPVGEWTRCRVGNAEFDFYPVVAVADSGARGRVPLSLRYTLGVLWHLYELSRGFDVFDFHRPEPSVLFSRDGRPKNAFFHNDPQVIRMTQSDNVWKHMPGLYERIEQRTMALFDSVWCVRESGVQALRERHPTSKAPIRFIPTWVDADVFYPVDDERRDAIRQGLARQYRLDEAAQWIVTVGRLDTQKNPLLMLEALARLRREHRPVSWLVIGDGVLRREIEQAAAAEGVGANVHFLGLQAPADIANFLRAADVYALSSAYEGMPMALLEALGSGLPAVVTDVGEVRRVVVDGVNGAIVPPGDAAAFASGLATVLDRVETMRGEPAWSAVKPFQPAGVLASAYANYRALGSELATLRQAAPGGDTVVDPDIAPPASIRNAVVGVPINLMRQKAVNRQVLEWARERQSRYICFVNVHSAVQASYDERHRLVLKGADIAASDGAPIAWTLRLKGNPAQERVDGPGTMLRLCQMAEAEGLRIGLYGSTAATLRALVRALLVGYPGLDIGYVHSPPFRDLTESEDENICADIERAGVELLFIGLGCPKQEYWMARHRGRIPAVMLGVGAAFEFHAGTTPRAPEWMREHGLEWFHRLCSQPRRLWHRYLVFNSVFLAKSAREAGGSFLGRFIKSKRSGATL